MIAVVGIGALLIATALVLSVGVAAGNQHSAGAQQQTSGNGTTIANTTITDTFKGREATQTNRLRIHTYLQGSGTLMLVAEM